MATNKMVKFLSYLFLLILIGCGTRAQINHGNQARQQNKIIPRQCIADGRISKEWRSALTPRMSKQKLDSISALIILMSNEERDWIKLIESKANKWSTYFDSLKIPFKNCEIPNTIYVFLGHSGIDDAFTYNYNTVCFDLTALIKNYGAATLIENSDRIDRLFAHELTHLIHKEWARINNIKLKTFKDSVLWECIYEGFGMYRSLSNKWLPQKGVLPEITKKALDELIPVFVDRLIEIEITGSLDETEKNRIVANLSRGPVSKKWGAYTIAIWLALEANGDDRNLIYWTDNGLNSVIYLAQKYLTGNNKSKFENVFAKKH